MVEQIGHTNIVHTGAVLPWLLWAVDGYLATGLRKRGLLIVALLACKFSQAINRPSLIRCCSFLSMPW
jgi:hypothetical protein